MVNELKYDYLNHGIDYLFDNRELSNSVKESYL